MGSTLLLPSAMRLICCPQVSELSHKLGSAQGSSQSLEQEVGQLRSQLKQLGSEKHSMEMQLSDTKAKLLALQEKVSGPTSRQESVWAAQAKSTVRWQNSVCWWTRGE